MDYKELREKAGLSQAEVAKKIGVHKNTYINWEQGCGNPSPENREKIENFFKQQLTSVR